LNKIISAFNTEVLLTHPNFDVPFCIQINASIIGLGVELFHKEQKDERYTITFAIRTLLGAKNYTITETELLEIKFVCQ